jgi:transposase-like protein
VEETLVPGANVSAIARRAGMAPSTIANIVDQRLFGMSHHLMLLDGSGTA